MHDAEEISDDLSGSVTVLDIGPVKGQAFG
jgi:hypothetical protein